MKVTAFAPKAELAWTQFNKFALNNFQYSLSAATKEIVWRIVGYEYPKREECTHKQAGTEICYCS